MASGDLQVYRDASELIMQMEAYIRNFPREAKYSHGKRLRDEGVELIKCICIANNSVRNKDKRIECIEEAIGHYESYKFIKRLAAAFKYLSLEQEAKIDRRLAVVGKQLMGWKINEENKTPGQNRNGQGCATGPNL